MEPWLICLLIALVSAFGSFVQRTSGFGFGIFVMLFFPFFLPSHAEAAAVSGLLSCCISGYNAFTHRKHLQLKLAVPLLCAALVIIPVAVFFSSYAPERVMKILLGVVLICFSLYFLFLGNRIRLRPTVGNGLLAGGLGGALSGLFSTGGPPVVLYLIHATPNKLVYFATVQAYFFITSSYSSIFRWIGGVIDGQVLLSALAGLLGCAVGSAVGGVVFRRLNDALLKKIIYIGMIVSGILMIL